MARMTVILDPEKFKDPRITAKGEKRAQVFFQKLDTLWFNTGSQCNIECANCYIKSSPTADHFIYLTPEDMAPYLDEIDEMGQGPIELPLRAVSLSEPACYSALRIGAGTRA